VSRRFRRTPVVPQMEEQDCGAACLVSVLHVFGRRVTLHEANRVCGISRDGVSAASIVRAAGSYGLQAGGKRIPRNESLPLEGLNAISVPSIVLMTGPHFAVYEGVKRGKVRLNDPSLGRYASRPGAFWSQFGGIAIGFTPGPDFVRSGPRVAFARDLWARITTYKWALIVAVLTALLVSVPGVAASLLVRALLINQAVGGPKDRNALFSVAAAVAAASVVIGTWAQQLILARVLTAMSAASSTRFLWRMLRLPGSFFHRRALGGLVTRVQLNDGMAVLLSGRLAAAAVAVVSTLVYLGALTWLDRTLAPIAVTVAVLQLALLALISRRRSAQLHTLHTVEARRDAVAFAGIAAIETLKAEGSEDVFFRTWAGWQARVLNVAQSIATSTLGLFTLSTILSTAGSAAAVVFGMHQLLDGAVTYPTLLAFLMLMSGFLLPMGALVGVGSELLVAKAQAAQLQDVEDAEPDPFLAPVLTSADTRHPALRGGLALRDVSFGYDPARAPLIDRLSFDLAPGEWVAVVGGSGSGKSTLARLACGALHPWTGDILLDGTARNDVPRAVVTSGVAYVEQRPRLFEGSVRDNLTMWSNAPADADLWAALDDAEAADFVRRRGGLDGADIAEDARNLSGGERQRLEIARALTGRPVVLVLDEATSALDADTEVRVNANLRSRGCTCLVFAHRLSTVRAADRILVMAGGRLVQQGHHDQLIATPGVYRDLIGELS
jgi:ABC-type bacteriocin/lantibiotic exporter with double-glycine peptidase domain